MRNRIIITVAAMASFAIAQAQDGSTPATKDARLPNEPVQSAPERSAYHDCLLNAGTETFAVMGLDASQVERLTALQARYKAQLEPPKETKATKGKSKKSEVSKAKEQPAAKVEQPASTTAPTQSAEPVDKTGVAVDQSLQTAQQAEPLREKTQGQEELAVQPETTLQTPMMPVDPTVNDELQAILTPEQWARWHKQCYHELGTGMIQP